MTETSRRSGCTRTSSRPARPNSATFSASVLARSGTSALTRGRRPRRDAPRQPVEDAQQLHALVVHVLVRLAVVLRQRPRRVAGLPVLRGVGVRVRARGEGGGRTAAAGGGECDCDIAGRMTISITRRRDVGAIASTICWARQRRQQSERGGTDVSEDLEHALVGPVVQDVREDVDRCAGCASAPQYQKEGGRTS